MKTLVISLSLFAFGLLGLFLGNVNPTKLPKVIPVHNFIDKYCYNKADKVYQLGVKGQIIKACEPGMEGTEIQPWTVPCC